VNRIWRVKEKTSLQSQSLAQTLKISPITAQLLINRGITDEMQAHHFLYADFASCHDPRLLKDVIIAADRIHTAIRNKEDILIYGDYDVDGITSTALLYKTLTCLGGKVTTYIPNRIEEGYGLNENAVKLAHRKKIPLIVTVDCGISAHKEIELANKLKIDVIVTDHHEIKTENLPPAYAIVNSLQKDCSYPFKHLAGVGIAYKLAKVLLENTSFSAEDYLDLLALGTVSDMAAQKGENRVLTKCGLKKLNETKNLGIKALIETVGLKGKDVSCMHIGYILGPRINAMGRIGSADIALRLLLTEDPDEAKSLADTLNRENRNRQKIEARVLKEALEKLDREINFKDSKIIVLAGDSWHAGVIGIVASRIVDKFYRPAIVIALNGKRGKGSGRSIGNFHLFNAINACRDELVDFGGHEGACGLVIKKENIQKFTEKINKIAKEKILDTDLYPLIDIDLEVGLSDITEDLIEELKLLVPFGPENPQPIFSSTNTYLKNHPRKIAKSGFKMWVTDGKAICEAISFRNTSMSVPSVGSHVSIVYSPSINTWQGVSSVQLALKDLKLVS